MNLSENRLVNIMLRFPRMIRKRDFYTPYQVHYPLKTLGNKDAAWTVIPKLMPAKPIVYSVGVGLDISFDLEMIEEFDAQVFAFDPTPKSINWLATQPLPDTFTFHPLALAHYNGEAEFFPPENPEHVSATLLNRMATASQSYTVQVRTLQSLMQMLGHKHIDVLKLDIEGAEYLWLDNIGESLPASFLLIEFHHRFADMGLHKTKQAVNKIQSLGYKLAFVSAIGEEYTFVKV